MRPDVEFVMMCEVRKKIINRTDFSWLCKSLLWNFTCLVNSKWVVWYYLDICFSFGTLHRPPLMLLFCEMNISRTFTIIIKIVKKTTDKMEWVMRVFQSRERSLMLTLLKSLVIPLLEYCCRLWIPWKAKDIQAIEAIQRTFTYKITEAQHLNYL